MTMREVPVLPVLALAGSLFAGNAPTFSVVPDDSVTVNSGHNYVIVSGIDDGDAGAAQSVTVAAVSSNPSVLSVDSVQYTSGDKTAFVHVSERGMVSSAKVTVTVTDVDGSSEDTVRVHVVSLNNPGINLEIHDILFWREIIPLTTPPVWSAVLPQASIRREDVDPSEIPITTHLDCLSHPSCTSSFSFYTQLYVGYLVPPVTGEYTFYADCQDAKSLWLSTSHDRADAECIIHAVKKGDTLIGTRLEPDAPGIVAGEYRSAPQHLTAGKVYAIHAAFWIVHITNTSISWEGPGIAKQVIPGQHLMPSYSTTRPAPPQNLREVARGSDFVRVAWNTEEGSSPVSACHVYLDGMYHRTLHDTAFTVDGLEPGSDYSIFVVAEDRAGLLSFPSEVLTARTYGEDTAPPSPPSTVTAVTVSDLAVEIAWSGATDGQSVVASYNIYLDGRKYNPEPWYDERIVLQNLEPATEYGITVEAVDGGGNVSAMSSPLAITTLAFDPAAPELGMKKAAASFTATPIANATGFGINASYLDGGCFTPNIRTLLEELQPNLLRWGALCANPLSFADYSGAGKTVTYAKFLSLCNELDAHCAIVTGVKDGTDWRNDPQTFAHFIEYLNGPSGTTHGARRAAEGFSEPLMANSKGLIIELGNEVWIGGAVAQIGSDYTEYGEWCREVARVMKASPYWDSTKMFVAYSGRYPHPIASYGLNTKVMFDDTGEVDMLTVSGYLGGNMDYDPAIAPGQSESAYYKEGYKLMQYNIDGLALMNEWQTKFLDDHKPYYFYESNMTTPAYNGRLGQAVCMVDYLAAGIEYSSVLPTIFHLTDNQWKLVRTAENNRKLPLFHGSALYNRFCRGISLSKSIETEAYLVDPEGTRLDMDPVGYYLYNNGSKYTIMLASRDFENDYTVKVNLPGEINASSTGKKYVLSGSDLSTMNAVVDSSHVAVASGMLVDVPRHSLVFIGFDGTEVEASLPFGYYDGLLSIQPGSEGRTARPRPPGFRVPCEIYNLLGRRIRVSERPRVHTNQLPLGTYILKRGTVVRKLLCPADNPER